MLDIINKSLDANCSQFPAQIDLKPKSRCPAKPKVPKEAKEKAPRKRPIKSDGTTPKPKAKRVSRKKNGLSTWLHVADGDDSDVQVCGNVDAEDPISSHSVVKSAFFAQDKGGTAKLKVVSYKLETVMNKTSKAVNCDEKGRITRTVRLTKETIHGRIEKIIADGMLDNVSEEIDPEFADADVPYSWLLSSLKLVREKN